MSKTATELTVQRLKNESADKSVSPVVPREAVMGKDTVQPKQTEQELAQGFVKQYQELCQKHGYQIVVTPAYKNRDDGTFSTILQTSIRKLPKKE